MRKPRLIMGLMSGTSHDGVDAAIVRFRGPRTKSLPELLRHSYFPFPPALRAAIAATPESGAKELCRLNFELGEVFAKAAMKCAEQAEIPIEKVDAIASHGQTICHIPPQGNRNGSTLQIGEPAVIAAKTGVMVVSDFRAADMAAGGQGAPLVPFADYILFRGRSTRIIQNIGGIANLTVVTPRLSDVVAFDTGPGNCMMDAATQALFGRPFDKNGALARKGRPDNPLLESLLAHPYFAKRPPKSTGTDMFSPELLEAKLKGRRLRPEDLLCTLTHLTAKSITYAYKKFVFPLHRISEVIVSGGGVRNLFLIELLTEALRPVPVKSIEEYGIPAGAKEAMSFAILANETLSGNPSNVPSATGAGGAAVLGKLTPPPRASYTHHHKP